MTTVIYHANCDDGFGAALAAYIEFGEYARYIPASYGSRPSEVLGEDVFILDFSYPRAVMQELSETAKSIVLLDHHKTAAIDLADLQLSCDSIISFDVEQSGAVLAWKYFHPGVSVPKLFRYIDDNDRWQFKLRETRYVIRNLRSYPQSFSTWHELMSMMEISPEFYEDFVAEGVAQERFFQSQVDFLLNMSKPHKIWLAGQEGLAVNATRMYVSDLGHRLAEQSGTFGMVWSFLGPDVAPERQVSCSLRSIGAFDVSEIARQFGGGGHHNAAGFEISLAQLELILN